MQSSPQRRQLFSLNNVCNWTSGPCSFLQANPITGRNPDSLLGFLVLNESTLKWLATERAPSTHFVSRSQWGFYPSPPSSILIQYQETKSSESNLQTMVKLTNFQQIAPSHVQPLFCPLLYIPSPASGSQGLDSHRQCGSISCTASLYRWGKKEEKSSLCFPFSFRSVPSAFLTPAPAPQTHGETQAFIVLR